MKTPFTQNLFAGADQSTIRPSDFSLNEDRGAQRARRQPRTKKPTQCAGFSLLEVLMAVTVLIIIVLVISLVFQQAHIAWGVGTRKAGAETTLRSIMGIIERDLTHAVDAEQFGQANFFPHPGLIAQEIEFVTLDGTNRMPQLVNYKFDGSDLTRTTYSVVSVTSLTNWIFNNTAASSAILNGSQPLTLCTFSVPAVPVGTTIAGLPLRVEIEAHIQKQGSFAIVSGTSAGRNRAGHPEDAIVVSP